MNESFLQKLSRVRLKDIGHIFLFLLAIIPAIILKKFRPNIWLICDNKNEARDNGYWFFKHLIEKHPYIDAVYAINKKSKDYFRVANLGEVIEYGSLHHWIYYLSASLNISSQKYGKPNAAVCYFLEVTIGILKNKRVFLQHGVICNDLPFLHYKKAKYFIFCCGAYPEYEFVRKTFGYPSKSIKYTGLCRFDNLHGKNTDKQLVLIMPTWRMWLEREGYKKGREAFISSNYYNSWNSLLNSRKLFDLLERYNKRAVFCMHRNMHEFEAFFTSGAKKYIETLKWQDANIPDLIKKAGILVTDYSSVSMDFAYMKKPLVYYQFDREDFTRSHLPTGYFDYERDGFGPVCKNENSLITELEHIFQNDCTINQHYIDRIEKFFLLYDSNNCERTYQAIIDCLRG